MVKLIILVTLLVAATVCARSFTSESVQRPGFTGASDESVQRPGFTGAGKTQTQSAPPQSSSNGGKQQSNTGGKIPIGPDGTLQFQNNPGGNPTGGHDPTQYLGYGFDITGDYDYVERTTQLFSVSGTYRDDNAPIMTYEEQEYKSTSEFMESSSVNAQVSVSAGAWGGSVSMQYNTESKRSSSFFWATKAGILELSTASLDSQSPLSNTVINQLNGLSRTTQQFNPLTITRPSTLPESAKKYLRFYRNYGTHYIDSVTVGGRFKMITSVDTASSMSSSDLSVQTSAEFSKVSVEAGYSNSQTSSEYEENREISYRLNGGSASAQAAFMSALFAGNDAALPGVFDNWVHSIADNPEVFEFTLEPLYSKVNDSAVRANLYNAYQVYLGGRFYDKLKTDRATLTHYNVNKGCGKDPVVSIRAVRGNGAECPAGYEKTAHNLNPGWAVKDIYICFKRGPANSASPITGLTAVAHRRSSKARCPSGYTRVEQDLNQGATGKRIYLCYATGGTHSIGDVEVTTGACSAGWNRVNQDLNQGAWSNKHFYLCYYQSCPYRDVVSIYNKIAESVNAISTFQDELSWI